MNLEDLAALLRSTKPITPEDRALAAAEVERVVAELVDLETTVSYSPRDKTGEESTRRVQVKAARALGRAR